MTTFQVPGPTLDVDAQSSTTPLVVLFERDDAIAVPMLSQLRIAGYDVRAARTPVELFDLTSKQLVALILIDLGSATAGRREFWVALDTQRRGRSIQVMTFRYTPPGSLFDSDFEPSARAMADVEVHGTHEFQLILEGVRQRVPLHYVTSDPVPGSNLYLQPSVIAPVPQPLAGGIAPIGAALGIPSPFMSLPPESYAASGGQIAGSVSESSSPFAHPASSNPFIETGFGIAASEESDSPFAQPYSSNPFTAAVTPSESLPVPGVASHAFEYQMAANPPVESFEERAARLSEAYASQFGISATQSYVSAGAAQARAGSAVGNSPGPVPVSSGQPQSSAWEAADFFDAWTPPGTDELEWRDLSAAVPVRHVGVASGDRETAFTTTEYAPALAVTGLPPETGPRKGAPAFPGARQPTPTEQSLSSVLVEGSLLSEQKLEALRGVQEMLSNVEIDFKLGELALLFKFLSPDQLLAALLVSRGLVTAQQIASLGRTKQDLASTGMDYTLADLLVMFDILPEERVRQIRSEIAS